MPSIRTRTRSPGQAAQDRARGGRAEAGAADAGLALQGFADARADVVLELSLSTTDTPPSTSPAPRRTPVMTIAWSVSGCACLASPGTGRGMGGRTPCCAGANHVIDQARGVEPSGADSRDSPREGSTAAKPRRYNGSIRFMKPVVSRKSSRARRNDILSQVRHWTKGPDCSTGGWWGGAAGH